MRIDLHLHSCFSTDGEAAPTELVALARSAGLDCIAVADHNRVDGVAPTIAAAGGLLEVVPAVELDCLWEGRTLHLLGYFIDHADPRYAAHWEEIKSREAAASEHLTAAARRLGIAFDVDALAALAVDGIVTGEMIAEVALADPANAANPLLAPYRPGGARSDNPYVNFYWDYCSPGKPAHAPVDYPTLDRALGLIVATGGVPVLAHPGQNLGDDGDGALTALARLGLRGVEAYSSYHSPEQCRAWAERAERLGLLATCGSDYHGKTKPSIAPGGHHAEGPGDAVLAGLRGLAGRA